MADLEPGLYDALVDDLLAAQIDELATGRLRAELAKVDPAGLPQRFGELVGPVKRLTAVEPLCPTNEPLRFDQPRTPLRDTVLITNARFEPSLLHELENEIHSAERIDLVHAERQLWPLDSANELSRIPTGRSGPPGKIRWLGRPHPKRRGRPEGSTWSVATERNPASNDRAPR